MKAALLRFLHDELDRPGVRDLNFQEEALRYQILAVIISRLPELILLATVMWMVAV